MIITKTPFRMSFFGGGTDMEEYFKDKKGAVLSTTFDKYCYVTARHLPPFFEYKSEVVYSKIERVCQNGDIEHPAVREAMKMLSLKDMRVTYEADLPARSGLGTSSSFAVGMLNAFHAIDGKYTDKYTLAKEAIYLERDLCNEKGGWQDQIAAAYGGLNKIEFNADGFKVSPVIISTERKELLNNNLMMFFTGFTRFSADVQKENRITDKQKQLDEIYSLVGEAENVLVNSKSDINEFGRLLDYTWSLKRETGSKVSTADIDMIYEAGIKAGALGGKLLGAGGGGFMVFYVESDKQMNVKKAMNKLLHIPFKFENSGSQIIYFAPEV